MFPALLIQHGMRMRHISSCGLPGSTKYFHIISQKAQFRKKKKLTEQEICFDLLCKFV
jgi:hypothetical protein